MLLDRNRVVHSRNVTYDSQSVTNPTPAPTQDRGEGQSIAECDGIEEIIDGFSAMDLSATLLRRGGECITQEGAAAAEEVPRVTLTLAQRHPLPQTLCLSMGGLGNNGTHPLSCQNQRSRHHQMYSGHSLKGSLWLTQF